MQHAGSEGAATSAYHDMTEKGVPVFMALCGTTVFVGPAVRQRETAMQQSGC